jgi:ATP-dependent Clp endopeptidase proteolytic subunit ClpP
MKNKLLILNGIDVTKKQGVNFDVPLPGNLMERWKPDLKINTVKNEENVIEILDVIGFDLFDEGITTQTVSRQLKAFGKDAPITILINSPGGDLFEGIGIYNLLKEHKGEITIKIIGLAASAASLIAMAGSEGKIQISKTAFFMIHNAWTRAAGDKNKFKEVAEYLTPIDDTIAQVYVDRSALKNKEEVAAFMDQEKWFTGAESLEAGLADSLLEDPIENKLDTSETLAAIRTLENVFKSAGYTRTQSKKILKELKLGKPGATQPDEDKPGAINVSRTLEILQELEKTL